MLRSEAWQHNVGCLWNKICRYTWTNAHGTPLGTVAVWTDYRGSLCAGLHKDGSSLQFFLTHPQRNFPSGKHSLTHTQTVPTPPRWQLGVYALRLVDAERLLKHDARSRERKLQRKQLQRERGLWLPPGCLGLTAVPGREERSDGRRSLAAYRPGL